MHLPWMGVAGMMPGFPGQDVNRILTDRAFMPRSFPQMALAPDTVAAQAYNDADISHTTSNSWQLVTFNQERFDTHAFHSTSSNTGRLTIPSGMAGYYLIAAVVVFAANATGSRGIAIDKNGMFAVGTNLAFDVRAAAPGAADTTCTKTFCIANLAVGDYVVTSGYQNSGGALNMLALFQAPEMTLVYLGK